ncbi:MAG: RidA family protein [Thermoplasmata archaeon]
MKEIIEIAQFSKAGPYSFAVRSNNLVFLSGQTGDGPDFKSQFNNAMSKIKTILEKSGSNLENVLKVTVYISNAQYFQEMNALYGTYFKDKYPARTTVVTGFANDKVLVELDMISSVD